MKRLLASQTVRLFPCCICGEPREVRMTKKAKPYMICDLCGMQMFVRVENGIRRFDRLVADAHQNDVWKRLADLQKRYQFKCPECSKKFWLTPELTKTSWLNGQLEGYRCPEPLCGGIAKPEKAT